MCMLGTLTEYHPNEQESSQATAISITTTLEAAVISQVRSNLTPEGFHTWMDSVVLTHLHSLSPPNARLLMDISR